MLTLPTVSASSRPFTSRAVSFLPLRPASGEVLTPIVIDRLGSSTSKAGSGRGSSGVGQRLPDRDLGKPRDGDDVAGASFVDRDPVQRDRAQQLADLHPLDGSVEAAPRDLLAAPDRPVVHAAQREAAEVGRGIQVGDQRLQGRPVLELRGRNGGQQRLEQRLQVLPCRHGPVVGSLQRGAPCFGGRIDDREVDLLLVGVQIEEELVGLVEHLGDPGVPAIHLVDHKDDGQALGQRLAQHEPGLRQRPFAGVHEQQDAVDHRQAPLDLAAEVRVPGRVDDVDRHVAVADRGVLRQDRDALLALEVHRVEHPLGHVLTYAERAGLPEHRIHQRGLAVVDVSDDRYVADVESRRHRRTVQPERGISLSLRLRRSAAGL